MERHALLTAEQVAEMLGVRPGWVYAESRAHRIPTVHLGRYVRYRQEAIEEWIVSREVPV
jgi:excisionase family DNA binding protein